MIKILLVNPNKGRNKIAFNYFLTFKKMFDLIGIQFVTYGKHDYVFMGNEEIMNKRELSLDDSINYGIQNVNAHRNPVFMFDVSDSTSLMGSYEVLVNSNAKFLFKNQLLSRDDYKEPHPFNKWWWNIEFGEEVKGYHIPDHIWPKIKLTNWNLGYHNPAYGQFINATDKKEFDVCVIYKAAHEENYDWKWRNDLYYSKHRQTPIDILKEKAPSLRIISGEHSYEEYIKYLQLSKLAISPYGMGEVCYRDFELMRFGIPMIKPDMSKIRTQPDFYLKEKTYISCKSDWSDLVDVIDDALTNYDEKKIVVDNARLRYRNRYQTSKFIEYWYDVFKSQPGIETLKYA